MTNTKIKTVPGKLNQDLLITRDNFSEKYDKMYYYVFNLLLKLKIIAIPDELVNATQHQLQEFLNEDIQEIITYLYELLTCGDKTSGKTQEMLTSTFIYNQVMSYGIKLQYRREKKEKHPVYSLDNSLNTNENGEDSGTFYDLISSSLEEVEDMTKEEENTFKLQLLSIIIGSNKEILNVYNIINRKYTELRKKQRERIESGKLIEGSKKTKFQTGNEIQYTDDKDKLHTIKFIQTNVATSKEEEKLKTMIREAVKKNKVFSTEIKRYLLQSLI